MTQISLNDLKQLNIQMDSLIACHECDLLQQRPPLPMGATARCARCGAVLYRRKRNSLDRVLALTIAGLILFIVANAYPLAVINA